MVALAAVPFAFLAGLARSRVVGATALSELVARLGAGPGALRDAVADALGDPSLELAYWLPERGEWVDAAGAAFALPEAGSARACTPVERDGRPVAMLVHDAAVADERELVSAVGGAAALALENERLDAELRANLKELRASRARIVESADAARRRIERDLHDGAQQQLVALALRLGAARSRLERDPRAAAELLDDAAADLDAAIRDLRELARGIHPAVLSDRGLGPALEALASRIPLPVEITALPGERLPGADRGGRVLRRRGGDHQRRALRRRHARRGGGHARRRPRVRASGRRRRGRRRSRRPAPACAASPIACRRSTGGSRSPRRRGPGRRSSAFIPS